MSSPANLARFPSCTKLAKPIRPIISHADACVDRSLLQHLSKCVAHSHYSGRCWTKSGQHLTNVFENWSNSGQVLARLGQSRPTSGQCRPELVELGPSVGPNWSRSARIKPIKQNWPVSGKNWPMLTKLRQISPRARIVEKLFNNFEATLGQLQTSLSSPGGGGGATSKAR